MNDVEFVVAFFHLINVDEDFIGRQCINFRFVFAFLLRHLNKINIRKRTLKFLLNAHYRRYFEVDCYKNRIAIFYLSSN